MRNCMINDIVERLKGLNEKQLRNVYDYVCDEEAEENHESKCLEILKVILVESGKLQALDEMKENRSRSCLQSMTVGGFINNESDT